MSLKFPKYGILFQGNNLRLNYQSLLFLELENNRNFKKKKKSIEGRIERSDSFFSTSLTYVNACTHIRIRTYAYTAIFLGDNWPSVVEVLSKSDIFTQEAIFVLKLHARCRSRIAKICVLVSPNFRSKTLFRLFFSRLWL